MDKQTVFLSHASDDGKSVAGLRTFLQGRTGNAVDLFASSDGQSIRLGANWVHAVEAALSRCRLMFVFVSPTSAKSRWLYFEAGYSYSKGIRVVPVGLGGVEIANIGPPLSLLQGFNMTSAASVGNLIAVINDEFNMTFNTDVAEVDFTKLLQPHASSGPVDLGDYGPLVDVVKMRLPMSGTAFLPRLRATLADAKMEFHDLDKSISTYGMIVHAQFKDTVEQSAVEASLYPEQLQQNSLFLVRSIPSEFDELVTLVVHFERAVSDIEPFAKVSSRAFGSGLRLRDNGQLSYDDATVKLGHYYSFHGPGPPSRGETYLEVRLPANRIASFHLRELIRLLLDRGIILIGE